MAKSDSSSGSGLVGILILLIVGAGIYYGYKQNGGEIGTITKSLTESAESYTKPSPTPKSNIEKKEEKKPSKTESYTKTSTPTKKKTTSSSYDGKKEENSTNKNLPSYTSENKYYFSSSFDFAWPAYTNDDQIIEHDFFTLSYNEKTEQADWVAYKLTRNNLNSSRYNRKDNFREDPLVSSKSATIADYKGSGYDRGHLAPAADFTWTKEGLDDSFYMSNMSPQEPGFNRGIWKQLEEKVRKMANDNGEIFVVTGPVYTGRSKKIGSNKVAVPSKYYKVILELEGNNVKGIGFILPNKKTSSTLSSFATSIDEVEKVTKLDFFPTMPDDLEKKIESKYSYSAW
ncbi:DNA/RNA non-specific endonuclease [Reichenbachiella versicolor]|uniref:DNA/RNA non-specific endonuclease n=1 Tax=Reichenbachiella versicolor TaxID=1821036 RepID=UPI000D6E9D99|nr:DNA/RNA non-specific endonuclease [Reichenbachiella versicolor]